MAAFCSASFLDLPEAIKYFVLGNFTPTLNMGLCLGPVFEISLYVGSFLKFFNVNSCSLVLASISVTTLFLIWSFHKFKIVFSIIVKPLSRYIAPIKASQLSEIILSSILIFLLLGLNVLI